MEVEQTPAERNHEHDGLRVTTLASLNAAIRAIENERQFLDRQLLTLIARRDALQAVERATIHTRDAMTSRGVERAARRGRVQSGETKVVRNAMADYLKEQQRPMHARELLERLDHDGITVIGKDRLNNVRAHLSHDARFRPIGQGRWEMVSHAWQAQPAGGPR